MNRDNFIAKVKFDNGIVKYDRQLPNIFKSDRWINSRFQQITDQESIKQLLESRMTSIDEFYTITKGLSLNDTFWLKPEGCNISWRDVNPYGLSVVGNEPFSEYVAYKIAKIMHLDNMAVQYDLSPNGCVEWSLQRTRHDDKLDSIRE